MYLHIIAEWLSIAESLESQNGVTLAKRSHAATGVNCKSLFVCNTSNFNDARSDFQATNTTEILYNSSIVIIKISRRDGIKYYPQPRIFTVIVFSGKC